MREGDALDFALSGRVLDADEALRTGLVSRVVDDPRSVADAIASGEPDALHVIKRRIRDRREDETQERAEATAFADPSCVHTPTTSRQSAGGESSRSDVTDLSNPPSNQWMRSTHR